MTQPFLVLVIVSSVLLVGGVIVNRYPPGAKRLRRSRNRLLVGVRRPANPYLDRGHVNFIDATYKEYCTMTDCRLENGRWLVRAAFMYDIRVFAINAATVSQDMTALRYEEAVLLTRKRVLRSPRRYLVWGHSVVAAGMAPVETIVNESKRPTAMEESMIGGCLLLLDDGCEEEHEEDWD